MLYFYLVWQIVDYKTKKNTNNTIFEYKTKMINWWKRYIFQHENIHKHFSVIQVFNMMIYKKKHGQIFPALNNINKALLFTYFYHFGQKKIFLFFKEPNYYKFQLCIIKWLWAIYSNIVMKALINGCKI